MKQLFIHSLNPTLSVKTCKGFTGNLRRWRRKRADSYESEVYIEQINFKMQNVAKSLEITDVI